MFNLFKLIFFIILEHENVGESSKTKNEVADEAYLEDGIPACKRVLCKKTQKIK